MHAAADDGALADLPAPTEVPTAQEVVGLLRELSLAVVTLVRRMLDHEPQNQAYFIAAGGLAKVRGRTQRGWAGRHTSTACTAADLRSVTRRPLPRRR